MVGKGYCQLDPHTTLTIASTTSRELRDQHLSVPLTLPMATYDADLDTLIALSDRAYKGQGSSGRICLLVDVICVVISNHINNRNKCNNCIYNHCVNRYYDDDDN